ncbi:unnamed protein product [Rotaria sp. Silwood1]|nr:unnamed protein product [Rotaria sp. Silwood1]
MDAIVNDQYKTLRSVVQGCLDDHRMQLIEPHEKEGFPSLKRMLHALQSKKLPRKLGIRARRERRVPNTPRRPIVAAIHAPATQVSKFLNDLLAPVFLRVARETTFLNGIDLVRALEKYVANDQQADNELYGRYIDDVFMTTNLAFDQVKERLENANRKEPNIRISYSIHSRVDFLDVTISNDDGQLKTSIFQKPAAEPYVLPYTSDHPRHVYHNIPYSALLRAVRICSDVEDFDMEHVRIDLS